MTAARLGLIAAVGIGLSGTDATAQTWGGLVHFDVRHAGGPFYVSRRRAERDHEG